VIINHISKVVKRIQNMFKDRKIVPVILCGGAGTRLWPVSRKSYPKQFSKLIDEKSLFQSAASICSRPAFKAPLIVTGEPFRFLVVEQLAAIEMQPTRILVEPESRNTAASVLAGALSLHEIDPECLMLVMPSDHVIADADTFQDSVIAAAPAAMDGKLVTFGIRPSRPETGYGYLELIAGAELDSSTPQALARFVEKPKLAAAVQMVESGRFLWNAGIFLFKPATLVEAFQQHSPEILGAVREAVDQSAADLSFTRLGAAPWSKAENISIDYAIMEKATNLAVMPYHAAWSDLGSWESVYNEVDKDEAGNALSDHATAIDCKDTLLRSEVPGLELVGVGLEDMIAIAMPDAVLVAKKSDSQRVKEVVEKLQARGAKQATMFASDHRPWGYFESIAFGNRFQVKRIVVHPGAALSLQSHFHRSEHWIVVQGTARVTVDETVQLLTENQSIYIPLGSVHRLENPGKVPMVLIEVQTGSYLGEDDIIRYEDVYSRQ
jgi:mannose-1-phosphate guanylyltransferase/mannose-6-phosphate isomerase